MASNRILDRAARGAGFDGVVIVDRSGLVAEIADGSLGLVSGRRVVWPEGIGRSLLDPMLASAGIATVTLPVPVADLALFDAAFVVCARGIAAVASVGSTAWKAGPSESLASVFQAYDDVPTT